MEQIISPRKYTAWEIIKSFWQSSERFKAYGFYALIVLMTIMLVGFDVVFNYWYNYFYNALQAYDKHSAIRLLVLFFILAFIYIVLAVYRFYLGQLFGLRWRRWLTKQLIGRWLMKRGYYYLETFDEGTDNPDQRIQEDVGALVTSSIDLSLGLVTAITTFIAFIYVLWKLSGDLVVPLGSWGALHIPGYLVWVALIYSLLGTYFTFKIGWPLVSLNFEQQRLEATFRHSAIDLRSHAENIALYRGEHHQKGILHRIFSRVLHNYYLIILRQKLLLWYTSGYNQAAVVLPLVVVLPNYFDKVFLLGGLMQSLQAFGRLQDSLSYLVNSYTQIANWQAINARLTTFVNHLQDAETKAKEENKLVVQQHHANDIVVKDVDIFTPRHEQLLNQVSADFKLGQHYLIKGPSGIGKSTFLRTLAGIWPYASGEMQMPKSHKIMFMPQKPYMPIGTLAEAILFPDKRHPEWVQELEGILKETHLEYLIDRLNTTMPWSEQLSPGEQQRIAFARIFIHKPDWVFLDESTSMLDLQNEAYMYELLKKKLPHCSIVSVGHRPTLEAFHDVTIDMKQFAMPHN